ncbi:hypothetical protein L596_008662 [Steinernema carpocapsae]|uniref:Uncharacterized protein n=1 Tax=Steinernema carpocapsae TaxID=34508 RepID=A0A4U5PD97_STECR|nr:hypothetical protein L596_008662 [Steinernema carpocapsae]
MNLCIYFFVNRSAVFKYVFLWLCRPLHNQFSIDIDTQIIVATPAADGRRSRRSRRYSLPGTTHEDAVAAASALGRGIIHFKLITAVNF